MERTTPPSVNTPMRNPRNGLALTVCQSGGLMRVFTGDTLR
jgi:hypothetical protein